MTRTARKFKPVVYTPKHGELKWKHPVLRGTPPPMETIGPYDPSKDKGIQLLKGGLKIAQETPGSLGAGHPDRRGAQPWWKTGWKSEGEAREFLKENPAIHKELFPEVKI
tara:strand:+ start:487 stop:816 length:330 start_codon:yes stop_codon:yes gene_type:complete